MQKTVVVAIDHMHWVPKLKGYRKRTNKLKVRKALVAWLAAGFIEAHQAPAEAFTMMRPRLLYFIR